nr:transposase [Secundilactobacillus pentosiphilus]
MEILPDHIHMMISFPPKLAPSSIVKAFKGGSAKQWFIQFFETKPLNHYLGMATSGLPVSL